MSIADVMKSLKPDLDRTSWTWQQLVDREPRLNYAEALAAKGGGEWDWQQARKEIAAVVGWFRPERDDLATIPAFEAAHAHCRQVFERVAYGSWRPYRHGGAA